jgi:hypothetical protein
MSEKTYYHFLSAEHAIDDLEQERIKVALIYTLNDPFELLPYLRYREVEKRSLYRVVHKVVSKKYGLLCFSGIWDEPLLWGHYADKHKGIAIGFEFLKGNILQVQYRFQPKRVKFELTNDPPKNEELFLSLAKEKYKNWEYENEYRMLVELKNCTSDKGNRFFEFKDTLTVKEIVLGCKFDYKKEIGNVIKLAKQHNAEIIPTRPGWEDYTIHQCGTKTERIRKMLT